MKKIITLLSFLMFLTACQEDSIEDNNQINANQSIQSQPNSNQEFNYSELTPFKILSMTEGIYESAPALQINLSLPIKPDYSNHISVTHKQQTVSGDWIISENGLSLYFPFIESDQKYLINVNSQLTSVNGKLIDKTYKKSIHTRAAQSRVRFLTGGHTLLKNSNQLPIEAVNVENIDLKFWKIKIEKYQEFLRYPNYRDSYSLNKLKTVADLIYTGQFTIDSVKNKTEIHNISLTGIPELEGHGIYFVTMAPSADYPYEFQTSWFSITNIGIQSRSFKDSIAVFTHKIPDASVYKDVQLTLYNNKHEIIGQTKTDQTGFAEFNTTGLKANTRASLIVAQQGNNTNIIRLNSPKMDLSDFSLSHRTYKPQELFLYAPRDLYRPGETVNINALLRNEDGQLVTASPIRVEIKRPDNRTFKTLNWQGDESAFYQTSFKVPSDSLTGRWRFVAKLANNDVFEYAFSVEDFLPERLKLDLKAGNESEHIAFNETPKIKVQSDYLYGAPASKNRFDATVTVYPSNNLFEEFKDYSFGSNHYRDYDLNFTTKAQTLDESGYGELTIKPNWNQTKFPLKISSYVSVYESGGRPIARKFNQIAWPYNRAIGVRSLWKGNYARPNQNNGVELIAVNKSGEKIALENVEVLLIRENYNRYWHWGDDGWSYNRGEKNIPVYSSIVNINADQPEMITLPLEYGSYRVELRHQQKLISSHQFFSGWTWYDPESANAQRPDQVKLLWNKDSLTAGESAELKITAPYIGSALITVESDKLLWKKTIEMTQAEQTIEIPIDTNWNRHDLHASVMVIRSGEIKRRNLPTRSFGIIHLPLNRDQRKLDVVIEHPEKVLPEQTVSIKVKAKNLTSNANAYLTLAAVDTGVLNVSNFKTPDPFSWFFEKRKYLASIHDMYASIIALKDGKNTHLKFGGDADLEHGGEAPKSEVQIVSLFSEKVEFNGDGEAEIEFKLPYFNGEVRLMAMAFNENQFASAESPMKIAAPIVIETSMPRFLAKGDVTHATIDVHNTESTTQTVDIKIQASSSLNSQIIEKQLVLKANQKEIIQLPIISQIHAGLGHIEINASSQENTDFVLNRKWRIGLRPAYPAIINKTNKMIEVGSQFSADAKSFSGFDDTGLQSVLKISNSPVLNAEEQIKHLMAYPYGCLEQTSSRAWPLLSVEKSDLALINSDQQSKIFDQRVDLINGAISRLLGMQRYDGSFGLWNNNSHEEYWLTVYVTDFMLKAQTLGYTIPEKSLSKAINRIQTYVKGRNNINSELSQYLTNANHFKLSYQAYAAYVLSNINQINLGDTRKLYDSYSVNAKSPLPLAHLASALEKSGDTKRANEAWLKVLDFKWDQNRFAYYGDYGSKIRDLSQIILLGLDSQLTNDLPKSMMTFIKPLQKDLYKRTYLSTQERGAIFKLAKALDKNKDLGVDWQALLTIAEKKETLNQSQDYTQNWYDSDASRAFNIQNTSNQPLFVDFSTQGYLKEAKPESHGISVKRRFFNIQGNTQDLSTLKTGDMVLVHLMLKTDKEYRYLPDAMIVDLLPAGLELENQNLDNSFKLGEIKIDGKSIAQWQNNSRIKHAEYRDDRFVAALALSSYRDNHVFYLARAVTPGEYTVPPSLVEDMYRPEIRAIGDKEVKLIIK